MTRPVAPHSSGAVPPGATLGVFGGGQLGRMFISAAKQMGYRVHVFSPEENSPAAQLADHVTVARDDDVEAVAKFANSVAVATFEFENVSAELAAVAERYVPLRPSGDVLYTVQNRKREKSFLSEAGFPCAPFFTIDTRSELEGALTQLGLPAVLKTIAWGYDGNGQTTIHASSDLDEAWTAIGEQPSVLEAFVDYDCEFSVIVARTLEGNSAVYRPILNRHEAHILDLSILGDKELEQKAAPAKEIAIELADALNVVGLICIEFFLTKSGDILINEIAPRPHNSGHVTIEASVTSQFEQQVRAVCGLPLGSTEHVRPAAMANLLGALWNAGEPNWNAVLGCSGVKLHLYGKDAPHPRRKMGHLTRLAETADEAETKVRQARERLRSGTTFQRAVNAQAISAASPECLSAYR